jgi:hypothetical protein
MLLKVSFDLKIKIKPWSIILCTYMKNKYKINKHEKII